MSWRRPSLAALTAAALAAAAPAVPSAAGPDRPPSTKDVVALARAHLDAWQPALGAIVAEERFTQTLDQWDALGRVEERRTLVSDVLLVQAPRSAVWMLFRDVISVDGRTVRDRRHRFEALFVKPGRDLVPSARRIAAESARYNLGSLARDLNTPAAAFIFLRPPFVASTRWRRVIAEVVNGSPAWKLPFEQKGRPYAIHTADRRGQPASGHIWIEPGSGRILRTELDLWASATPSDPRAHITVVTHFGPVPQLDVWVPLRMDERYTLYSKRPGVVLERFEAEARYTNHRRFQTGGRLVP